MPCNAGILPLEPGSASAVAEPWSGSLSPDTVFLSLLIVMLLVFAVVAAVLLDP